MALPEDLLCILEMTYTLKYPKSDDDDEEDSKIRDISGGFINIANIEALGKGSRRQQQALIPNNPPTKPMTMKLILLHLKEKGLYNKHHEGLLFHTFRDCLIE
ncbi:hypothetical protein RJT34_17278 [Clitoria ternatea]|uniref:Uncharacterized protein n=1 Tax=Clitoria ternatea TaxID=43366 RepID=A0AAN9J9Y2_CLITE